MPFQRERELPDALTSGASAKAHRNLGWDFNYLKFLDEGHGSFSKQPESPSIESFIEQAVVPMSIPDSWPTDRQLMSEIRMVSQTATLSAETAQAHMSEWSATGSGGDTQPLSEGGLIALLVLGSFLAGTIVVVAIQLLWRRRSGFKGTRHGGGPALPSTNFQMHASVLHEVITPSFLLAATPASIVQPSSTNPVEFRHFVSLDISPAGEPLLVQVVDDSAEQESMSQQPRRATRDSVAHSTTSRHLSVPDWRVLSPHQNENPLTYLASLRASIIIHHDDDDTGRANPDGDDVDRRSMVSSDSEESALLRKSTRDTKTSGGMSGNSQLLSLAIDTVQDASLDVNLLRRLSTSAAAKKQLDSMNVMELIRRKSDLNPISRKNKLLAGDVGSSGAVSVVLANRSGSD